jgi:hypothetical protein
LAGLAADVLNNLVGCIFRCGWLLRHLDLLIDKMNQKSSLIQILKSVQQVLTSDTGLHDNLAYPFPHWALRSLITVFFDPKDVEPTLKSRMLSNA